MAKTRQPRLPGADWHQGDYLKMGNLAAGARQYAAAQGLKYSARGAVGVKADPNVLHTIGGIVQSQQGAPAHMSPQLHESYAALHEHINRQYEHLTSPTSKGGMGISVEVSAKDPYSSPHEARADVATNQRLKVLATDTAGSGNPMMPTEINDKFRAVHDAFGHLAIGRDFTRHGEEAAVQHHARMFPPEAHAALFSELRGQNSALIRGGAFPENKPYNLPDWANKIQPKLPVPKRKSQGKQLSLF